MSTKQTPFKINYGIDPMVPALCGTTQVAAAQDLSEEITGIIQKAKNNLQEAQQYQKQQADGNRTA